MIIGAMNYAALDTYEQIEWIAKNGFDFVDLSLEPTKAIPDKLSSAKIKNMLKKHNLKAVGHTSWELAQYSYYQSFLEPTISEFKKKFSFFKKIGIDLVNFHIMPVSRKYELADVVKWYSKILSSLHKSYPKIKIMVEHTETGKKDMLLLYKLMTKFPWLYLHLDAGHANLHVKKNITPFLLKQFGDRLAHVHFSDNKGDQDEHLALGKGNINWKQIIKLLKKYNYDETITLEIHTNKKELLQSKTKLRKWWDQY